MAELNRAFALVRPVSMSDETASDWLAAALAETSVLDDDEFSECCAAARRECSYHGQIVPRMMRDKVDRLADVKAFSEKLARIAPAWQPESDKRLSDNSEVAKMIEHAARSCRD